MYNLVGGPLWIYFLAGSSVYKGFAIKLSQIVTLVLPPYVRTDVCEIISFQDIRLIIREDIRKDHIELRHD